MKRLVIVAASAAWFVVVMSIAGCGPEVVAIESDEDVILEAEPLSECLFQPDGEPAVPVYSDANGLIYAHADGYPLKPFHVTVTCGESSREYQFQAGAHGDREARVKRLMGSTETKAFPASISFDTWEDRWAAGWSDGSLAPGLSVQSTGMTLPVPSLAGEPNGRRVAFWTGAGSPLLANEAMMQTGIWAVRSASLTLWTAFVQFWPDGSVAVAGVPVLVGHRLTMSPAINGPSGKVTGLFRDETSGQGPWTADRSRPFGKSYTGRRYQHVVEKISGSPLANFGTITDIGFGATLFDGTSIGAFYTQAHNGTSIGAQVLSGSPCMQFGGWGFCQLGFQWTAP